MDEGITITVRNFLKPELADEYRALMPPALEETRKFPGFRHIIAVRHRDEPNELILIEEWDDLESYQAYINWRIETGFAAGLDRFMAAPAQVDFWSGRIARVTSNGHRS